MKGGIPLRAGLTVRPTGLCPRLRQASRKKFVAVDSCSFKWIFIESMTFRIP